MKAFTHLSNNSFVKRDVEIRAINAARRFSYLGCKVPVQIAEIAWHRHLVETKVKPLRASTRFSQHNR